MPAFALSPHCTKDAILAALCGGIVLGTTVACRTWASGGVLGISGITRTCMVHPEAGKAAFVLGLLAAGAAMSRLYGGTEPIPPAGQDGAPYIIRMVIGGFLVGIGTTMGNGCTSGHGLTGLARFSKRSWAAVPTFMGVAMMTATLLNTSEHIHPDHRAEAQSPPASHAAAVAAGFVAATLAITLVFGALASKLSPGASYALHIALELVFGCAFGGGLAISTMARPSKVAGFVDLGSGAWDASLAFVMCGGLLITTPFFQILERKSGVCPAFGGALGLPPKDKALDRDLIVGAVLFGIGWGMCAMCPGPLWVIVGAGWPRDALLAMAAMLIGMLLWVDWQQYLKPAASTGIGAAEATPLLTDARVPS